MSVAVQDSLLDFGDEPTPAALRPERVPLSHGAWIDVQRGWLAGSAALFGRLVEAVPWKAERRRMYDRTVDVPRLLASTARTRPCPTARSTPAGTRSTRITWTSWASGSRRRGCASTGTGGTASPCTATPSGAARARTPWSRSSPWARRGRCCCGRARADGSTLRYNLGHGDLIVMGGSCQRTWEHGIPKSARPTGPRISVQFRPARRSLKPSTARGRGAGGGD